MIAAVTTTRDEADIIESTVRCLLEQGVGLILAADSSMDETPDILERLGVGVTRIPEEQVHRQPYWMNYLAAAAGHHGAEWIVPFDADEFWFGLEKLPGLDADIASAELWHHRDPNFKYVPAERLPKVAFRWAPGAVIASGNHSVSLAPLHARSVRALEIRHYQFRSFEHFKHKVHERSRTLDPAARARGDGSHMTRFEHASEDELLAAWAAHFSQSVVFDPIPGF